MIPDLEEMVENLPVQVEGQHVYDFPNDHFQSDQEKMKKLKSQDRNHTSVRFVKNMIETKKEAQEMM